MVTLTVIGDFLVKSAKEATPFGACEPLAGRQLPGTIWTDHAVDLANSLPITASKCLFN